MANAKSTRWQAEMSEFFEALEGQAPDEAMSPPTGFPA